MKTIILPGYSLHNKDWALDIKKELKLGHPVLVHEWRHWRDGSSLSLKYEMEKIGKEVGEDEFNIIGKSVGARMAIRVISELRDKVKKVILCGVASISGDSQKAYQKALTDFPPERIICFQNTKDPFVPYQEVKKFIHFLNKKIKVVEKGRSDHHYPYLEDFQNFLKS